MKPLLEKGEDKNGKENEDLKHFLFIFFKLTDCFVHNANMSGRNIWINFEAPQQYISHNKI